MWQSLSREGCSGESLGKLAGTLEGWKEEGKLQRRDMWRLGGLRHVEQSVSPSVAVE